MNVSLADIRRRVARIFRGGRGEVRLSSEDTNLLGGPGAYSPRKILEFLDCLGLHFARVSWWRKRV